MSLMKLLSGCLVAGVLSVTALAQNPETGALMTDPNIGCAYGYDQYGYMNCGGSNASSGSARSQPPKVINRYGAIAMNSKTGSYNSSFGQDSSKQASKQALDKCGSGCRISTTYANQCVAMAWGLPKNKNKKGSLPLGFAEVSKIAESKALEKCNITSNNCQIVLSECSKYN